MIQDIQDELADTNILLAQGISRLTTELGLTQMWWQDCKELLADALGRLELQSCGHPVCAIRCENENAEQTDNWCGWCADIEKAQRQGMTEGVRLAVLKIKGLDEAL